MGKENPPFKIARCQFRLIEQQMQNRLYLFRRYENACLCIGCEHYDDPPALLLYRVKGAQGWVRRLRCAPGPRLRLRVVKLLPRRRGLEKKGCL